LAIQPIFAIVNPQAGSGRTQKAWPRVLGLLKTKFEEIDWAWTRAPGHATDLARDALDKGYQCILSVGGDGTHNEIANAFLCPTGSAHPQAVLAPLSMGTGSDLRRSLGIPKDVQSAVSVLAQGRVAAIDVGWLTFISPKGQEQQRYFLNITSLGIGGEVDLRVNLTTKALGGFFAFLWGTLSTLCTYHSKRIRFALDGGPWRKEKIILIAVANGQYFGGGMWMAPQAALDDGAFDVIVVKNMNRLELIATRKNLFRHAPDAPQGRGLQSSQHGR
jgi:YegS/Rv2252/BmrU family lipid kinase